MKSVFKLLEKTAGPIGLLLATIGAALDFLAPLGSYIYFLVAVLIVLTALSAICNKNSLLVDIIKSSTSFIPDFIKNEIAELWQPNDVVFWKKGLFQVLSFLTALSVSAAVYAQNNPKGFLATKIESVADLQSSLGFISSRLDDFSLKQDKLIEGVVTANKKLDLVKKETSENPRKELANMGISWTEDSFLNSIKQGDLYTVELFLKGGMNPESKAINYSEHSILSLIVHWNVPKVKELIILFEKYGLNISHKFLTTSYSVAIFGKQEHFSILTIAIESNNLDLIKYLLSIRGFTLKNQYDEAGDLYAMAANSLIVKPDTFELLTKVANDKLAQSDAVNLIEEQLFELERCIDKKTSMKICIGYQQLPEITAKLKIAEGK